jgi:hypothetical protein
MKAFMFTLRSSGYGWSVYDLKIADGPVIGEIRSGDIDGVQLTINAGAGLTAEEIQFLHEAIANL